MACVQTAVCDGIWHILHTFICRKHTNAKSHVFISWISWKDSIFFIEIPNCLKGIHTLLGCRQNIYIRTNNGIEQLTNLKGHICEMYGNFTWKVHVHVLLKKHHNYTQRHIQQIFKRKLYFLNRQDLPLELSLLFNLKIVCIYAWRVSTNESLIGLNRA